MTYTGNFFFDKTDLFNKIKKIETILGLNDNFDANYISVRIQNLEQLVDTINSNYTTKQYVDDTKISKYGDTLQGELVLANSATQPLHPVTKQQFDEIISTVVHVGNLDW